MAEAKKQTENTNWADMDNEDEENEQEIGVDGKPAVEEETKATPTEEATQQPAEAGTTKSGYPKRQRKDYGAAYDPNYKKAPWRKGDEQQPHKKTGAPAIARQKNERGDYVVTSF